MSADPLHLAARFRDSPGPHRHHRHGLCRPALDAGRGGGRLPHVWASTSTRPRSTASTQGRSPLEHVGHARIAAARAAGRFEATADFARLAEPDALLICVPTPLGRHREPDLCFVEATTRGDRRGLRPGQLVVLESTT